MMISDPDEDELVPSTVTHLGLGGDDLDVPALGGGAAGWPVAAVRALLVATILWLGPYTRNVSK